MKAQTLKIIRKILEECLEEEYSAEELRSKIRDILELLDSLDSYQVSVNSKQ